MRQQQRHALCRQANHFGVAALVAHASSAFVFALFRVRPRTDSKSAREQNLRRYYDTRMRHPYLSNAFKYAFAHSIVLFGAFNPELLQFNKGSEVTSYLFVTVFVISTLYTYSWDIFMDWSLGDIKHGLLRRERMFAWRAAYYVAIVVDFVLRFVWTMTLVPVARVHFQDGATVLDFAGTYSLQLQWSH